MRHLLAGCSKLLKFKFWFLSLSLSFIGTLGLSQAPTVDTPTVTAVGTTTATLGGNVTGTLTHRGTRWHTASPVGTNNQLEEASTTAGAFTQPRTGLPPATKLFFVAYARNAAPEATTAETTFFTEPVQLTGGQFTASASAPDAITLTFPSSDSWKGTGVTAGYVIYRKTGSAPSVGAIADGAAPPADGVGDKITTITNGASTSFNDTGLSPSTNYFYTIVPFVWDGATTVTYNYNLATPQSTNATTLALSATFTPINGGTAPVLAGTAISAGITLRVLTGFSVTSNGSQDINNIGFNYSGLSGQFINEYLYRSTTAGTIGTPIITQAPSGNFNVSGLGGDRIINSTPVYYYLVVDVANSVTSATASVTVNPTQANINVATGVVNSFSINRSFTFSTSQLSDITLIGGETASIDYKSFLANSINDNQSNSVSLADYKIRDGGAANDPDNKGMSVTSIEIQITNSDNLRRVALFDDVANTEIPGTEQGLVGSGTVNITFTPTTPISIADNGSFDINVRATFKSLVTDKQAIRISIVSATTNNTTLSGFSPIGSWASTQTASNTNVVAVVASQLQFVQNPPDTPKDTPFVLTLEAIDDYDNRDLDYAGRVDLTATVGPGTLSLKTPHSESLSPFLAAGIYNWTRLQINQAGTYTLRAKDDAYSPSPNIGNAAGSVAITSSASTVTQPAALNLCFGGLSQTLGNIVLTETDPAGFSSGGSFSLTLPSGFVFDQSVTTPPTVGGGSDISAPSTLSYPSSNTVQFSYTISGTANTNSITITGLKIIHPHPGGDAPGTNSGPITRSGGTASIAGVGPGTALGTVNAALGSPAPVGFGFSVQKLNSGDVDVNPNETRFSQNSNAVRLVGTPAAVGGVTHEFIGSGVTFISGEYRFNPQSLSPGTYPIVFKYRDGTGQKCEFQTGKTFEIYTTNITNLNAQYCNNDNQTLPMNVDSYIATFYTGGGYSGWALNRFIFWNTPTSSQQDIVTPSNNIFDPKFSGYQQIYSSTGSVYGVIGIWIGFIIEGQYDEPPTTTCSTVCFPLIGCIPNCVINDPPPVTQTRTIWQLIPVRTAPKPSFSIPNTSFCSDEGSVTLTGNPANSNSTADDFFSISSDNGSISGSSAPVVWSFTPANVSGLPKSLDITYTYRDPSTGCTGTSSPTTITVNSRPTTVPLGSISRTPTGGAAPSTTIELCQGVQVGSFAGAAVSGTTYNWYSDAALTKLEKTTDNINPSFTPPVDNTDPRTSFFYVTRKVGGCESDKSPTAPTPARELTVIVHPTPGPPVPDFDIDYCVNQTIDPNNFKILSGTNINWYKNGFKLLNNVSSPTLSQITTSPPSGLGVDNSDANTYTFEVTQSANNCEGLLFPTKVNVIIKPLPKLRIDPKGGFDPLKICTTDGTKTFVATDGGSSVTSGTWSILPATVGVLAPNSPLGTVDLNPLSEVPDNYGLNFQFTNNDGCQNNTSIPLRIQPKINALVTPLDFCEGVFVRLNNQSVVDNGNLSSAATIALTSWNFGDGDLYDPGSGPVSFPNNNDGRTKGTYFSPEHKFKLTGSLPQKYTMITSDNCSYTIEQTLKIDPKPEIDFNWRNVCRDGVSSTQFSASEKNSLPIATYFWSFNDNNTLSVASAQNNRFDPTVNYSSDGTDFATLIATTTSQCKDTVSKPIYIVPKFTPITDNNSYTQDFNVGKDGWLIGGSNPSWEWGVPSKKGSEALGSKGNGWDTRLNGTNNPNEQSWVLSRCFNFSQSLKPVIGLDIFSETPFGVNGAAIQYNYNGNIEDNASWNTLGEVGKGINWYDNQGLSNSPGNQTANDLGWTGNLTNPTNGKYKEWQRAYYQLDELLSLTPAQKSNVVFRIAFAAGNSRSDGFAFDDFFIGERSRLVLLENFTNSSSNVAENNNKYRTLGNPNEIVRVQYHTPFPGDDAINKLNTPMHNARTAFYGITKSPTMRLDGIEGNLNTIEDIYDDRVLTPSALEVTVTATKVGSIVEIVTSIRNKSSQTIPLAGAHIFTTIVEKNITTSSLLGNSGNTQFAFVGKQMLPTPTGLAIPSDLAPNSTYTAPKVIWEVNNGDAIVVSVQSIEGNNKEVYQAGVSLNPPQPDIVTGIEHIAEFIQLYPNPANDSFVIELPTKTDSRLTVHLIDQVGRLVHESTFETGEQTKTINTQELAGGIYVVQIGAGKSGVVRKKMMIVHKN